MGREPNSRWVYEGAFASRDVATASRMSTDTVFRIASMVQPADVGRRVATGLERGTLKLDEPAGNIDPALASAQVLTGFDAKGVPQTAPGAKALNPAQPADAHLRFSYPLWDQMSVAISSVPAKIRTCRACR